MIAIKKMIKKIVYIACNRIENPNDSKRKKKITVYFWNIKKTKKFDIWHFDISLTYQIRRE